MVMGVEQESWDFRYERAKVIVRRTADNFQKEYEGWFVSRSARIVLSQLIASIPDETVLFDAPQDLIVNAVEGLISEFLIEIMRERKGRAGRDFVRRGRWPEGDYGHDSQEIGPIQVALTLNNFLKRNCHCLPQ